MRRGWSCKSQGLATTPNNPQLVNALRALALTWGHAGGGENRDGQDFTKEYTTEWYCSVAHLVGRGVLPRPTVRGQLGRCGDGARALVLGCGLSAAPLQLLDAGYAQVSASFPDLVSFLRHVLCFMPRTLSVSSASCHSRSSLPPTSPP